MPAHPRPQPSWPARLAVILAALTSVIGLAGVAPADAAVYSSCTISRCAGLAPGSPS